MTLFALFLFVRPSCAGFVVTPNHHIAESCLELESIRDPRYTPLTRLWYHPDVCPAMSSPAAPAIDPPAKATSPVTEPKTKKPRQSRAKKEEVEKKEPQPASKDSKDAKEGAKAPAKKKAAKTPGEKHPPFEEIIRECITESTADKDGVSRPAIKSTCLPDLAPTPVSHVAPSSVRS